MQGNFGRNGFFGAPYGLAQNDSGMGMAGSFACQSGNGEESVPDNPSVSGLQHAPCKRGACMGTGQSM